MATKITPTIQLSSENGDFIEIPTIFTVANGQYFNYILNYNVPYGFGMNSISVGIFGIADQLYNYNGYATQDLKTNSFPYAIKTTFTLDIPILKSSTTIYSSGGSFAIFGRGFGKLINETKVRIDFSDGYGYVDYPITSLGNVLMFDNVPPINASYVSVYAIKKSVYSAVNSFPVTFSNKPAPTPTPTNPTPTPKDPTTCIPNCNNNGKCINSICVCQSPWYGPSCSSKIVIIPVPPSYPDPVTGTNITESGSLITTSIEIIGVRELDATMNVVQTFNISKWYFTDLSKISTNPKYFYSTQLDNRSTLLNVSIEYFKNSDNITFADEQLFIPESTIKFSMNMSSYQFKDQTNLIQILMRSSIQTDKSDVCSSSGVGVVDKSVQWIKLNVGDNSLYGRFLSKGVVDNRVRNIQNIIIEDDEDQTKQIRSAVVGMTVGAYGDYISLDPDFSNLIDVGETDTSDFICSSSKKLSNGAIAGIVVGVVVFVSIGVALVILFLKKKKFRLQQLKMEKRMREINKGL
ncbi:hypothetical protein PPL_01268 [Heterostelium album PN500]|uniref:EGF-like domain-containing protein n=1 Tax=Heterostelium pallidum (strain ATCC 26659 / Pp 5 / PN500) TaxID=670386 RepID=D3AYK8_HETP5|nr:hypothetical protein PPL_01268 [Heterostelium album PN500]EFA86035.1 hypothetical protein PPL_01268 [Heterostelium album PN500]|eukprot:XP_020438141.1 hypothetical protein PPL_01268 [Heterostelium album PN500]